MPLYEYQCAGCGTRSEVIQQMSAPPLTTCDDCGGDLKKLVSAPAFRFKGSGWYVTDYAKGGAAQGESESKAAGSDNGDKGDGGAKVEKSDAGSSGDKASAKSETGGKTKSERVASAE